MVYISRFCLSGCEHDENVDHLFVSCTFYGNIPVHIRLWFGIYVSVKLLFSDHFT